MAQDPEEAVRVAEYWARSSEWHDIEKFEVVLHEDFEMWYNFDPNFRTRAQFLDTLRDVHAIYENHVNADTRITPTIDGFVMQATLTGQMTGKDIAVPFVLVAQMKDGKVVRGWEYFDTGQLPKHAGKVGEGMID